MTTVVVLTKVLVVVTIVVVVNIDVVVVSSRPGQARPGSALWANCSALWQLIVKLSRYVDITERTSAGQTEITVGIRAPELFRPKP